MTKVVFFGTEIESALILERLIENNFDIVAVVTKPDSERGRGQKLDCPPAKKIAKKYQVAVFQPTELSELNLPKADIGILVSYGKIIPQAVIDNFPHGIINIHPSLLPKYRGPSPIETAIINGDNETGVSIMSLDTKMDAGPVYIQEKIVLDGTETKTELYDRLFNLGASLLIKHFDEIISGALKPMKQDNSSVTYCRLLTKSDGILDPIKTTADECERKVRAFLGFPKTRIDFKGREVIVVKAHIESSESENGIKCKDGQWFVIDELISPSSGKQMKTADYLRGLK